MALIDESREAFRALRSVMDPPATIEFNGISKDGICHSVTFKRAQHLQGYQVEASSEFELEDTDFAEFVAMGLKDRVSKVLLNGTDELLYMTSDAHPNSAVKHLFLASAK